MLSTPKHLLRMFGNGFQVYLSHHVPEVCGEAGCPTVFLILLLAVPEDRSNVQASGSPPPFT